MWKSSHESRAQLGDGGALEAPVERAQEVAPVAAVQCQQGRGLAQKVGDELGPPPQGKVAAGQPGVGVDHVRGHQGVLEVEHGQMPVGRQDGPAGPLRALLDDRAARGGADPGVLHHRGEVHVVHVVVPVDNAGIEAEGPVVLVVEGVPQGQQPVHAIAGVGLGVGPVELDVPEGPLGQGVTVLNARRQFGLLAAHR